MSDRLRNLYEDAMQQLTGLRVRIAALLDAAGPAAEQDRILIDAALEQLRRLVKDLGWDRLNLRRDHQRRHCPPPRRQ
jgi:hypothetical protein